MSFLSLGLAVLLVVHLVVSTALSVLVALVVPRVEARPGGAPARRASLLLGLGLLPALGGLVAALGFALPAWLVHEPRGTGESAGPVLAALAAVGAALVLGRVGAALLGLWRTSRLVRRWEAAGRPLAGLPFPATRFAHEFPVAAVFGLRHGRLFLADRLVRALSPEELDGVVAHEAAHHAAHDNLKRVLLEASPDLLALTGAGARLRRAFEDGAEAAADARACARVSPLVLARTLLKVASLVPPGQRLDATVAALHRDGSLSARVQALVAAHDQPSTSRAPRAESGPRVAHGLTVAFAGAALAIVFFGPGFVSLRAVHGLLEALVHLLS